MARSLGPHRWSLPSSAAVHGLVLALAAWSPDGRPQPATVAPEQRATRSFALYYLDPPPAPTVAERPGQPPSEPDPSRPSAPVPAEFPPIPVLSLNRLPSGPTARTAFAARAEPGFERTTIRRSAAALPAPRHGVDRGAELLSEVASACPDLRKPAWTGSDVAVSVGFVVDTNGTVDSRTLQVVRSPARPQTDHSVYSHIYTVATGARDDPDRLGPAAYDSLMTRDVAAHVMDLAFRPALREGQAIRSTVLVSCQAS